MAKFSEFRRYPSDGYVAGVCAGIAAYMDWNVKLIRASAVIAFIFGGIFPIVLIYAALWYVMEAEHGTRPSRDSHSGYSRAGRATPASSTSSTMGDVRSRFSRMEDRLRNMEDCVASNEYELRREFRKLQP